MYLVVYTINPAGVSRCYLTDSSNFKIEIGSIDEEHDQFKFACIKDSIFIYKETSGNRSAEWEIKNGVRYLRRNLDTIERKVYKLSDLQNLNNINNLY
jgi:hypothetical protein